jgi:hypothetical protein
MRVVAGDSSVLTEGKSRDCCILIMLFSGRTDVLRGIDRMEAEIWEPSS